MRHEAHHVAVLLDIRRRAAGLGHRHLLVSDRGLEARLHALRSRVGVGCRGTVKVGNTPIGKVERLLLVWVGGVRQTGVPVNRRDALGQHRGHHGQRKVAPRAAVDGVVMVMLLIRHRLNVVPPVAVLHVHVELAVVGFLEQIVLGQGAARAVLAQRVPHAHERLALHGRGARLRVERRLVPGVLVRLAPRDGTRVGHLQFQIGGRHRVVLHGLAVDGRHVGRSVQLPVRNVVPRGPTPVHAVGLHVARLVGLRRGALPVVDVEHLVVGA